MEIRKTNAIAQMNQFQSLPNQSKRTGMSKSYAEANYPRSVLAKNSTVRDHASLAAASS